MTAWTTRAGEATHSHRGAHTVTIASYTHTKETNCMHTQPVILESIGKRSDPFDGFVRNDRLINVSPADLCRLSVKRKKIVSNVKTVAFDAC